MAEATSNEDQSISTRDDLLRTSIGFLREGKNMSWGAEMEKWLNKKYGEESELYHDLAWLVSIGVAEGWDSGSGNYRCSRISSKRRLTLSIQHHVVYMNSNKATTFQDEDHNNVLRGGCHGHPYGEINLVVPLHRARN